MDFYIIDMQDGYSNFSTPLLLGRSFMKTARMKIDVHEGTLSMEFDGRVVRYRIDSMEETSSEKAQPTIVCGVHDKPPDGNAQKIDSKCKKQAFVIGQEV